jgi:hypothetical protein
VALVGLRGWPDSRGGGRHRARLPRTVLVGLPDSALYQARDRCKAAVSNSGQEWPIWLLTINLSPPTLPKAGSHYDDAIVARCSRAEGVFRAEELRSTVLLGELGLDGRLRPVRGPRPSRPGGRRSWSRSPTTCPTPRTEGFNRVIKQTKRGGFNRPSSAGQAGGVVGVSCLSRSMWRWRLAMSRAWRATSLSQPRWTASSWRTRASAS